MDVKPHPNRGRYLEVLRRMSPEQRLLKSFELTELARQLLLDGLRAAFPALPEAELRRRYLERLDRCHNRNY